MTLDIKEVEISEKGTRSLYTAVKTMRVEAGWCRLVRSVS
jgi:hypothetical protein